MLFIAVAVLHALLLCFMSFTVKASPAPPENARVMKVMDLAEEIPPPPLPPPPPPPPPPKPAPPQAAVVSTIAETMVETTVKPVETPAAPINTAAPVPANPSNEFLPIHKVEIAPKFDLEKLGADLARYYPRMAKESGLEGRVILELFVDRSGEVQQIRILQENPTGRGFGAAAVEIFTGRRGTPAWANGEPVSARFRFPVSFRLK